MEFRLLAHQLRQKPDGQSKEDWIEGATSKDRGSGEDENEVVLSYSWASQRNLSEYERFIYVMEIGATYESCSSSTD